MSDKEDQASKAFSKYNAPDCQLRESFNLPLQYSEFVIATVKMAFRKITGQELTPDKKEQVKLIYLDEDPYPELHIRGKHIGTFSLQKTERGYRYYFGANP